ncbi:ABC transporter permease [Candidatus Peregrinibacteria bacterium]|nr:ABC transporter permease [Candidatus Peregrinibacteria bacterium]
MLSWISYKTIARKEIVRFLRIWRQTLLPPVITQTLYFVIFGAFIGSQVRDINGVSYMAFLVPGLVMMAVINNSFANVVSSFFGSKFQKNYEELMVSPTPNRIVVAGYISGGVFRGLLVGFIVFLVSIFFTQIEIYNLPIVFLFVLLTSILFSLAGFINAIFSKKFDDISIFSNFVLIPLTYFGGVFYSIKSLPDFWQMASRLNPILYMIDGFRYGFHGFNDVSLQISLLVIIFLTAFLLLFALYLMKKGIGLKA